MIKPGDIIIANPDDTLLEPSLWKDDKVGGDEVLISRLKQTHLMLVISLDETYAFVLIDNMLGYVNASRMINAFR